MRGFSLLLVILAGCADQTAKRPSPTATPKSADSSRQLVPLDGMTFVHSSHKSLLKKADAAARQIAKESWRHEPFGAKRPSYVVRSTWDSGGEGTPTEKLKLRGHHVIRLAAYRHPDDASEVLGAAVRASWRPSKSGWGASVAYFDASPQLSYTYQPDSFALRFHWCPAGVFDYLAPAFEIYEGVSRYETKASFDGTEYTIDVWTRAGPHERVRVNDETVLRWLGSATSMRDEALANLDELAKRAAGDIPSGKAVRNARQVGPARKGPSPVGALLAEGRSLAWSDEGPQAIPPPKSYRAMTVEEKRQVLKTALAEIANRKVLVRENYQTWFTALGKAFPLRQCLETSAE